MASIATEVTEITELNSLRDLPDFAGNSARRGRIFDAILVLGFSMVIGAQLFIHFGRKTSDTQDANLVGPPRPAELARR